MPAATAGAAAPPAEAVLLTVPPVPVETAPADALADPLADAVAFTELELADDKFAALPVEFDALPLEASADFEQPWADEWKQI